MADTVSQLLAKLAISSVSGVSVSGQFALILRSPYPMEDDVAVDSTISLRVVDLDGDPAVAWAHTAKVYVDVGLGWEYAYDGSSFQAGYDGGSSASSSHTPASDYAYHQITIDPTSDFSSRKTIRVRVIVNSTALDEIYTFRVADVDQPQVVSAESVDQFTVRVRFDDMMSSDVLDADNWTITRNNVDPLPGVTLTVTAVELVDYSYEGYGYDGPYGYSTPYGYGFADYDLTVNWEQTPGCPYTLEVDGAVTDSNGNTINASYVSTTFTGYSPATPASRNFSIWHLLPGRLRELDDSGDLERFTNCLQEALDLMLYQFDHFADQWDIDLATDEQIDLILYDLGNPFNMDELDLTAAQKRKLASLLVSVYQLKGTNVGIENLVFLLLGKNVEVVDYVSDGWILGESSLGDGSVAKVLSDSAETYDFSAGNADLWVGIDGGEALTASSVAGGTITVSGEVASSYPAGTLVEIVESTANDGTYTVDSAGPTEVNNETIIPLVEALSDDTGDGRLFQVIRFTSADFAVTAAATADEVVDAVEDHLVGGSAYVSHVGTQATITCSNAEPYNLSGSETLTVIVNGGSVQTITFYAGDFVSPGNATAAEVATRIEASSSGLSAEDSGGYVKLDTLLSGEGKTIEVTGGTANAVLGFSTSEVDGTQAGRVVIHSDTWGPGAVIEIAGGTANAILDFVTDAISGSGAAKLGPSTQSILYSFDLETSDTLTTEETSIIRHIVEWMKPANTHLRNIRQPLSIPTSPWWILGESQLDIDAVMGS